MEKENRLKFSTVAGLLLMALTAAAVVTDTLNRIGLGDNYVYVISLSLLTGLLLMQVSKAMVLLVLLGLLAANLPDTNLQSLGVDRDLLLALVCAFIVAPNLYYLVSD